MHSRHYLRIRENVCKQMSALRRDLERPTEDRLRGGGSQADYDCRLQRSDLCLQPRLTCRDLDLVRLFMDPTFATRFPLEVLYDVRDIAFAPVDSGFCQGPVE